LVGESGSGKNPALARAVLQLNPVNLWRGLPWLWLQSDLRWKPNTPSEARSGKICLDWFQDAMASLNPA